jgi:hypothetical protein
VLQCETGDHELGQDTDRLFRGMGESAAGWRRIDRRAIDARVGGCIGSMAYGKSPPIATGSELSKLREEGPASSSSPGGGSASRFRPRLQGTGVSWSP